MSWPAVVVFTVLATCAVMVVVGYFRGNRKMRAVAEAARANTPVTLLRPASQRERDEAQGQSDSWIWR
jgi:hypothetical protein